MTGLKTYVSLGPTFIKQVGLRWLK